MINDRRIRTSLVAIGADIVLTAIKVVLALFTGSAALLADAYHSATDFIVSLILLCGIIIRERQEKKQSETGIKLARRIESILAIAVALIILYVPVEIVQQIQGNKSEQIENVWYGILGMLVVIAIVFFMARLKTHVGKETDSIALEADGYHSMVDLFSSFAVLLSLIGFMIGLYLDNIVALLIAVMIAVSGLELLVSGFRSLIKGSEFDQLSFVDVVVEFTKKVPIGERILTTIQSALNRLFKWRYRLLTLLAGLYLLSGFSQVPYGATGVKQVFNQSVGEPLSPGLHYSAPWPMGGVLIVDAAKVYTVFVGSSVALKHSSEASHGIWREIKQNRVLSEDVPYMVTGDENLIDINFTLHYRLSQPIEAILQTENIEKLVSVYTESSLWKYAGQNAFADIIESSHRAFSDNVASHVKSSLDQMGVAIEIVDAQLQSIQPPAMVVSSYRDVLTAVQEKEQGVNRAIAKRLNDLPTARAQVITQTASTQADAIEKLLEVQGNATRMSQLAQVYRESEQAFKFEHYIDSAADALSGKSLVITDPKISPNDIRDWLNNNRDNRKQ